MSEIRDAATVIVLRAAKEGLEVMLLRRHARSGFMAGAYVFPGGKVDAADLESVTEAAIEAGRPIGESPGRPLYPQQKGAILAAAIRETHEEASITLSPEALVYWAHWITPSFEPRRFDTRFFVAELLPGQEAKHDEHEITDLIWRRPSVALEAHQKRELFLPPPTQRCLEELADLEDFAAVRRAAEARVIAPILPKVLADDTGFAIVLPWDPDYATLEGEGLETPANAASGSSRIWVRVG